MRQREWQLQPSSHCKSIAATVCWSACLCVSWIACSLPSDCTARLLCSRGKYDHVTPLLRDILHWLPVPLCVEFKVCLLVYKSLCLGTCATTFIRFGVETSIDGQMRSSRKTDEGSVWRLRLLSCWPQMMEQTSCCSAYGRLN